MLGNFSEWSAVLANLATAVAVGFAAYQLYLLNRHAKVESHARLVQSEREIWTSALQLKSLQGVIADVWKIGDRKPEEGLFWAIFLDSCEHMFIRYNAKILSNQDWSSIDNYIGRLVRSTTFGEVWTGLQGDYSQEFIEYVNAKRRLKQSA